MVSGFPMGLRSKRLNPLLAIGKGIRANGRQTEEKREANRSQVGQRPLRIPRNRTCGGQSRGSNEAPPVRSASEARNVDVDAAERVCRNKMLFQRE